MTTTTDTAVDESTTHGKLSIWAGLIVVPMLWGLHLQLAYMLVPWVCVSKAKWALYLTTALFLVLTGVGGYLSWYDWRRLGGGKPSGEEGGPLGRSRFVAVLAMMSSTLFFIIILATGLATFFFDPCAD